MKRYTDEKKSAGLSIVAILSFLSSLVICFFLASEIIINVVNVDKLQIEQLVLEKTFRINAVISRLLYKANSLSAIVIQGKGVVDDFEKIAPIIAADNPTILNVLLAPDCVVSNIYPLNGNEAMVGFDYFSNYAGNKEAIAAIDSGRLMLGGPFKSIQGGEVIVGMLPVYIDTPNEKKKFWGLVSVALKFPQVLNEVELETLESKGLSYELWRINPDTNEKQVIMSNYGHSSKNRFIEKRVSVFNTNWHLRVWPVRSWYDYPQNVVLVIAGFLISFLLAFVMQNNYELRQIKTVLECMARSDPLTGIYNRRHFMDISLMYVERARRLKEDCYIIIFDLDKFKDINDTYGHIIGDNVLIETASRIKAVIRPYDLFARYGGEEFIIYISEIDKNNIVQMVERLRVSLCDKKYEYEGVSFTSSASFGVAYIDNYDIKKAISYADKALYAAKKNGRNKIVFWNA